MKFDTAIYTNDIINHARTADEDSNSPRKSGN